MSKIVRWTLGVVLGLVLLTGAGAAWALYTTSGSAALMRLAVAMALRTSAVRFDRAEGSIARGVSVYDVSARRLPRLPPGARLQAQRIDVGLVPWRLLDSRVDVFNARLLLPDSDPILLYGTYADGQLDVHASSPAATLQHLIQQFAPSPQLASLRGTVKDLHARLTGPLRMPLLHAGFLIDELARDQLTLTHCPAQLNLTMSQRGRRRALHGEVACKAGEVRVKHLTMRLHPSRVMFNGDPAQPSLSVHGTIPIEDTKMRVKLTGTPKEPKLHVSSSPPRPTQQLLLMLATGQNWTDTEAALRDGKITVAAAQEMVGYLLGGSGNSLGGVKVSFSQDADSRTVGVDTAVTDTLSIGYELQESLGREATQGTIHSVTAARELAEDTDLELEVEQDQAELASNQPPDIYLKFKQQF